METVTEHKDITKARAWHAAERAGAEWALGLKIGDKFLGAMPVAKERYATHQEQHFFISGALDEFRTLRIVTNMEGVLIVDPQCDRPRTKLDTDREIGATKPATEA